jgi:hypothetical protein
MILFAAVILIAFGWCCIRASRKQPHRPAPVVLVVPVEVVIALPPPPPALEETDFAAWSDEMRIEQ